MTHQQLRGSRSETAAIDRDGRQRRKRMLRLFDVVEADHGKVSSNCRPSFGKRANKADRDNVVVTKGGGLRLAEIQQLRAAAPPPANVITVSIISELSRGSPASSRAREGRQTLAADGYSREAPTKEILLVPTQSGVRSPSRSLSVFRRDQRGFETWEAAHYLNDRHACDERFHSSSDVPIAGEITRPAAPYRASIG